MTLKKFRRFLYALPKYLGDAQGQGLRSGRITSGRITVKAFEKGFALF
jgi:hypothetical protein